MFSNQKLGKIHLSFTIYHLPRGGFTVVELLIVVGVIAILAAITTAAYFGTYRQSILDSTVQEIAVYLRFAQQKAFSQEEGQVWGVHFENPSSGDGFYELFFGSPYNSNNAREKKFLPSQLKYLAPASGASTDVIFAKLTGNPTATASLEITFKSESAGTSKKRVININASGVVTIE
ncbi:MAG: Tfp pilus assembly protein FimT/FimU [Candidatus Paceibacteria bacterium]